jgi:hypothetical protein
MRWLIKQYQHWRFARGERAKLARVEEELRIRRELDYLEQQRNATRPGKILTLAESELMGQSITDLSRRC